jgi:hypothetical protein
MRVAMTERIRIISDYQETLAVNLRTAWNTLLSEHSHSTLFYQSPRYFDHLADTQGREKIALAAIEDGHSAIIGIVPLWIAETPLHLRVRNWRLGTLSFSSVRILGGQILLPRSPDQYESLFRHLATSFASRSLIHIYGLPTTSALWRFLQESPYVNREFLVYLPYGPRPCHTAQLPDRFDTYLAGFKHKKRYNLQRQLKQLREYSRGTLALRRIESPADVAHFQDAMTQLINVAPYEQDSSTISHAELLGLARRGLLLSYVLTSKSGPYALAFGTRFMDTLLVHKFAHDKEIDHLSPGTVLHTLMMEDLICGQLANRVDYGFGEPKYRLLNKVDERVTVLLMRKTLVNLAKLFIHASFEKIVRFAKVAKGDVAKLAPIGFLLRDATSSDIVCLVESRLGYLWCIAGLANGW